MDVSGAGRRPDAVITLGEWEVSETGERVELACVVMRLSSRVASDAEPLDIVRPELPVEGRELALWVLEVWRRARGVGS